MKTNLDLICALERWVAASPRRNTTIEIDNRGEEGGLEVSYMVFDYIVSDGARVMSVDDLAALDLTKRRINFLEQQLRAVKGEP